MHDDVIASFDDCLNRLTRLRAALTAARPVRPGERRHAVEQAILAAEHFATAASRALAEQPRVPEVMV
ncbi:hypothetical protein [Actinoplanes sp. NPDC049265]|uniref:hypothetical protein n=1 Tax=Actinoplanes sp. NPDC049265 TaxID=3363902 RepID=UPI00372068D0